MNVEHVVVIGWTAVLPEYVGYFGAFILRTYAAMLDAVSELSPEGTYIEIAAQGTMFEKRQELSTAAKRDVGMTINAMDFPVTDFSLIGHPREESRASVTAARFLKIPQIPNVGSVMSLGPVFIRDIRNSQ